MKKIIYILLFWSAVINSQSLPTIPEVFVDINSGNPTFPFPQFLAYTSTAHHLDNLATQNAVGVVHAEMEQDIRDAWQIMANAFKYTGTSHAGVRYIRGNLGCPYDCSEGDGYALLAAAEMADKTTFDGLWFRTHDLRLVKQPRYSDCVVPDPGYRFGEFSLKDNVDSAADGDVDIALALLVAYKQWGEDSGYKDACGNIINYKQEALNVIRGLVERTDRGLGDCRRVSGVIGYDGYMKGGNTWLELTNWASSLTGECPEFKGPTDQHIDYYAPSYFHAFIDFLNDNGDPRDAGWNVNQLARAEASSDWLMGKMLDNPVTLPLAGWVELPPSNQPIYKNFLDGEDFRNPWRTVLNYVWHGDPENTWNPATHQVENGNNSFEQLIGKRLAVFLNHPGEAPWNNDCSSVGGGPSLTYNGPSQIKQYYSPNTGKELSTFPLNWLIGTGSPSAVAAQDFGLMGKLYRQAVIEWNTSTSNDGYLTSIPQYFHGFFRLLGMLTLSGNHHSPSGLKPEANLKVYHKVNKTFAFVGDEVEYTISYRNYASVTAENVTISTTLPTGMSLVSATDGGTLSGSTINWNIGNVPGFKSSTGIAPTQGEVSLILKIEPTAGDRICNTFDIKTSNGKGWSSNEYPNERTAIMQRNCIDVAVKALEITKTANHSTVNVGDQVNYTVNFKNASSGGFLNGGRKGIIPAYAHQGHAATSTEQLVMIRLYHGADEAYIDYGNYRISLFINDNGVDCVKSAPGCTGTGWVVDSHIYEGGDRSKVSITSEKIVPGSDATGAWNQRVIIKFSNQLATITPHISRYFGIRGGRVHLGGAEPLRAVWSLHNNLFSPLQWDDDWSWNPALADAADGLFYPVTNDWTNPDDPNVPVTIYHNEACEAPSVTVNNILIEEWDGFTWRRVFGNSPAPGREVENVVLEDQIPDGFTFLGFTDELGNIIGNSMITAGARAIYDTATRTITWRKPIMQVKEEGTIRYALTAGFSSGICPRTPEEAKNTASIEAKNESHKTSTATVTVTCTPVILPRPASSMDKTVTPLAADVGDKVTYNLEYTNNDGANFNSDFTESWTTQSGTPMTLTANTSVNTASNRASVFTNDFSHGTNGSIEAEVNYDDNQAFGFVLRHSGGGVENGVYIVFKPNSGSGNVETKVFSGTTEIRSTTLTASSNPIAIRLQLDKDQLQVWLGNISNPVPTWSVLGIPERAGYNGVINGFPDGSNVFGNHSFTQFKSHFDSAFDLQITDPVPTEVNFLTASDSGNEVAGTVTFPVVKGPILAGTKLAYSWEAEVLSCPTTTAKIVNVAFTNGFGIPPDFISAQAILDCSGSIPSCPIIPTPIVSIPTFCEGEVITSITPFITATETLVWYNSLTATLPISEPVIDTSIPATTTFYVAQKNALNCESTRALVDITVTPAEASTRQAITVASGIAVNYDIVTELGFRASAIRWKATTDNTNITGETLTDVNNDLINEVLTNTSPTDQTITYEITEAPDAKGCFKHPAFLEVTVRPEPLTVTIKETITTEGNPLIFDIELSRVSTTATTLIFTVNPTTASPADISLPAPLEIIIPNGITLGSFSIDTIDDSLIEMDETVELILASINGNPVTETIKNDGIINDNDVPCPIIPTPMVSIPTFCEGEVITSITPFITATETLVWYDSLTATLSISEPVIDTSIPTTTTFYVAQKNALNCESTRAQVDITVTPAVASTRQAITVASGVAVNYDIVTELGFRASAIRWKATTDNTNITGETLTDVNNDLINEVLTNTSPTDQIVTYEITEAPDMKGCFKNPAFLEITVRPEPIKVTIKETSAAEGTPLIFDVELSRISTTTTSLIFMVNHITSNISDISLPTSLEIMIPSGFTLGNLNINTIDDTIVEIDETLELTLISINGNPVSETVKNKGTIIDNDVIPCPVIPPPVVTVIPNFCEGEESIPDITSFITHAETLMWYASPTGGVSIAKPNIDTRTSGLVNYYVSQKTRTGCESSRVQLTINITPLIPAKFVDLFVGSGEEFTVNLASTFGITNGQISWRILENKAISKETTDPILSDFIQDSIVNNTNKDQQLTYAILNLNPDNCIENPNILTVTVLKSVEKPPFPLFFTPNSDFENDLWQVGESIKNTLKSIEIYDRYGDILYSYDPKINPGWDGTYNGVQLPNDDYWYVAVYNDGEIARGHFSLIR